MLMSMQHVRSEDTGNFSLTRSPPCQLTTENNRYKRQLYDLQQRLADIEAGRPTKKGEASSMLALRARVREGCSCIDVVFVTKNLYMLFCRLLMPRLKPQRQRGGCLMPWGRISTS